MSSELVALIDEVKRTWRASGVKLLPGATDSAIAEFEARHGVRMPPDLGAWFRGVGGTEGMEDEFLRFWSLAEVVPDESSPQFFVFADFLIESHYYGFRISEEGTAVFVLYGDIPVCIGPTFESFLGLYLRDPHSLFPPLF